MWPSGLLGTGHKSKQLVLQCISLNQVEGGQYICQMKYLILTLLCLIFRRINKLFFSETRNFTSRYLHSLVLT